MSISFIIRLRDMDGELSTVEHRIADYFVGELNRLPSVGMPEVAAACKVSKAAIVRFCKKLGYQGYKAFRQAVHAELALENARDLKSTQLSVQGMTVEEVCRTCARVATDIIREADASLDTLAVEHAVNALLPLRQVSFMAWGFCVGNMIDARNKFSLLGYRAEIVFDQQAMTMSGDSIRPGEMVLILVCGAFYDKANLAREQIAKRGGRSIVITPDKRKHPPVEGSLLLGVNFKGHLQQYGPMENNVGMALIVNILYLALAERRGAMSADSSQVIA